MLFVTLPAKFNQNPGELVILDLADGKEPEFFTQEKEKQAWNKYSAFNRDRYMAKVNKLTIFNLREPYDL